MAALLRERPPLDTELVRNTVRQIDSHVRPIVRAIVERDSLPHLSHLINGWGNACVAGRHLADELHSFAQYGGSERGWFVPQCDSMGDFHPWQSFAYCFMAGIDPSFRVLKDCTLRTLALNSHTLKTSQPEELGHLLFSIPFVLSRSRTSRMLIRLGDQQLTFPQLVESAIDAHLYGHYRVCRKFHLTEGLCAVATYPGIAKHRKTIQTLLECQVTQLMLLVRISQVMRAIRRGKLTNTHELDELRSTLSIGDLFENQLFYLGHLVEMCCFAFTAGFALPHVTRFALNFAINETLTWFPAYITQIDISAANHCLSHLRRGITLYLALHALNFSRRGVTPAVLASFTTDFTELNANLSSDLVAEGTDFQTHGVFRTADTSVSMRSHFDAIVSAYNENRGPLPEALGVFAHFRKIIPQGWPRALHFEILDYGNQVGLEIHLESKSVARLGAEVKAIAARASQTLGLPVVWDSAWSKGNGRAVVHIQDGTNPMLTAQTMIALIGECLSPINSALLGSNLLAQ
jgi:hypothetical protein